MAERRVRVTLDEVLHAQDAETHRRWTIHVDGEPAGLLEATRDGGRVRLACTIAESARGRGVARAAVGRFLGMDAFVGAESLWCELARDDDAGRAVATGAGFTLTGFDESGLEVWERMMPPPRRPRTGPERFLAPDGRVDRYPLRATERAALLQWIAERALSPDDVLDEAELGERLRPFDSDVALLRRYLVDHGLLVRTPSGSEYTRPAP